MSDDKKAADTKAEKKTEKMVEVEFLQGMASMENNRDKGARLPVGEAEAGRLIEKGIAKLVTAKSKKTEE